MATTRTETLPTSAQLVAVLQDELTLSDLTAALKAGGLEVEAAFSVTSGPVVLTLRRKRALEAVEPEEPRLHCTKIERMQDRSDYGAKFYTQVGFQADAQKGYVVGSGERRLTAAELKALRGSHFDPEVIRAALRAFGEERPDFSAY